MFVLTHVVATNDWRSSATGKQACLISLLVLMITVYIAEAKKKIVQQLLYNRENSKYGKHNNSRQWADLD